MRLVLKPKWHGILVQMFNTLKPKYHFCSLHSTMPPSEAPVELQELCSVVSSTVGGLDDLESRLNRFTVGLTSSLVTQILESCKSEAPTRRLLRFFLWSHKNLKSNLEDKDFNYAIRVLAEKKDQTAIDILVSDLRKEGRVMEAHTFSVVAETLVKLGKEEQAFGIFKNLDKFKCPLDSVTVTAIVSALCSKGHIKIAEGVIAHHKDKISGVEACIYRCLLYGWSVQENGKQARKVIQEMKSAGIMPDLFCYNTLLRCICKRNLKRNPSGLVSEALDVMMEMRSYNIAPTSVSYNILLSCLGRNRRIKESYQIFNQMKETGCAPDWVTYYLVVRVLYLSGRFTRGNNMVSEMMDQGLIPDRKFYYDLIGILCGVERVRYALELFERMKGSSLGGYGPVYDLLIPKLCRGGEFEKARQLWDEAVAMGVTLRCASDVLDPSVTEVFKPTRDVEEEEVILLKAVNSKKAKIRTRAMKTRIKVKKKRKRKKKKKKNPIDTST
ncbi:PPR domain-containing protein/PPR_2 domain-containing protein/PPR_3 domain-containing protein [Cephalotus follicularis]|uniref:PPR domain-containing protein/PPR_2 domain-containing protein/PPR_3 domain-containing protein n=1 Tax=Cephalotus follicularis TaxID=3775 RepID=A0A1Q3BUE0_CEPFO|nr:PPR domain-containing protein/PPR_2 domain-containing protein/PPR_3 domain-containing protein [Cephalotus follicularis]